MRLLIKLGGTLLDDERSCHSIAAQLAELARGHELIVVHGGGKQMTRFLEERSISSRFIDGLRVSDAAVIDAALKVIAGSVNKRLVSAIIGAGQLAVGISGLDGALTIAEPLDPALAFVGKPVCTETRLLSVLVTAGFVPVVACIAGDGAGIVYNVNADQMAVSCALAWQAEKLLLLTDVTGVRDESGRVLPHLAPDGIRKLIDAGIARGGMQAKLNAASLALAGGIAEVMVAPGDYPHICARLLAGEPLGTRLSASCIPESVAKA